MEWIVEPLKGFKGIIDYPAEACPHTWNECSCTAGLWVCQKGATLTMPET